MNIKPTQPADEELVEAIARELCEMRGEDPRASYTQTRISASGTTTEHIKVIDLAKRDVRFIIGWIKANTPQLDEPARP